MKTDENFTIDFTELLIFAQACIPPVPIARSVFFEKLSEIYYKQMDSEQRKKMFDLIIKNYKFDKTNEDCLHFYNRFNPENQYRVLTFYNNKKETISAYLHNGKYHVSKNKYISIENIVIII